MIENIKVSVSIENGLPNSWCIASINEIVDSKGVFVDGDWVESKDQDPNGDVRLIQLADIGDGYYRNRSNRFLTKEKAIELNCTFLEMGDVLIARMPDPLGRGCIFSGDPKRSVTVVDIAIIRTGQQGANHRWLMYAINSPNFRAAIESLQSGTTRKRISRRNLASIQFPVPPFPEQKRIVAKIEELFTQLDAGVEALKRAQAKLKRYKASVLKAACEGWLVPTEAELARQEGREYEPASVLLERILKERRARWEVDEWGRLLERAQKKTAQAVRKAANRPARISDLTEKEWQSIPEEDYARYLPKNDNWKQKYKEPAKPDVENLPELPEGWVWGSIDEITRPIDKVQPRDNPDDEFYYLDIASIDNSNNIVTQPKIYSGKEAPSRARQLIKSNDVLFSTVRTYLRNIALVAEEYNNQIASTGFSVLRSEEGIFPKYLFYFVLTDDLIESLSKIQRGTSYPAIRDSDMRKQPIPIPPSAEQKRIIDDVERRLSVVFEIENTFRSSFLRAKYLRQAVLKRAFEGKLVLQDPNDEPASVLLERIKERYDEQE